MTFLNPRATLAATKSVTMTSPSELNPLLSGSRRTNLAAKIESPRYPVDCIPPDLASVQPQLPTFCREPDKNQ